MKLDIAPLTRFIEHLPKNGDVELGLLKCHLLIEEVLTKLISSAAINPEFLAKARLTFAQKICLARALSRVDRDDWMWVALKKINDARNELSHGLLPDQINAKLEDFIAFVEASQGMPSKTALSPFFGRFHWAAFKLFSHIVGYAHFDPTALKIPTALSSGRNRGPEQQGTAHVLEDRILKRGAFDEDQH